ncbi:MAG: cupin domain-containing protein [Actinomycetia bacterium]|nr:cupin domain-containing protein [Actinomycetes bacterium]
MEVTDNGPQPASINLEQATRENENYRTVAWTGHHLQLTLMSIPPGESIGLEAHPDTDQFLRLDAGQGRVTMGPTQDNLEFEQDVVDGWCVFVPAGTWHDIINTGAEDMRLYAIYAPVHHAAGRVHPTAADAERDEDSGEDVPPAWAVVPPQAPDQHA